MIDLVILFIIPLSTNFNARALFTAIFLRNSFLSGGKFAWRWNRRENEQKPEPRAARGIDGFCPILRALSFLYRKPPRIISSNSRHALADENSAFCQKAELKLRTTEQRLRGRKHVGRRLKSNDICATYNYYSKH